MAASSQGRLRGFGVIRAPWPRWVFWCEGWECGPSDWKRQILQLFSGCQEGGTRLCGHFRRCDMSHQARDSSSTRRGSEAEQPQGFPDDRTPGLISFHKRLGPRQGTEGPPQSGTGPGGCIPSVARGRRVSPDGQAQARAKVRT